MARPREYFLMPHYASCPTKTCSRCRRDLPRDFAFNRDARRPDGRFPYCKQCRHDRYVADQQRTADAVAADG